MTAAILLLVSALARAQAPTATLQSLQGRATLEASGARRDAKQGDALPDGSAVETAKNATAVIALPDGTQLKLRELSRVAIELPAEKSKATGLLLAFGGVFARVAKQAAGSEFRVKTERAVVAVRGTEFFTAFGKGRKKGRDLWVCVNDGAVDVSTDKSKKPLRVPAGKGVLIKSGVDLTEPQAYDWTKKLNWNDDPAKGSIEDKTDLGGAYADPLEQNYR